MVAILPEVEIYILWQIKRDIVLFDLNHFKRVLNCAMFVVTGLPGSIHEDTTVLGMAIGRGNKQTLINTPLVPQVMHGSSRLSDVCVFLYYSGLLFESGLRFGNAMPSAFYVAARNTIFFNWPIE